MPQVSDFPPKQLALLWIQLQAGFSEPLAHFPQVEQVLLEGAVDHDDVVQIHKTRILHLVGLSTLISRK
jgi:hypothetical protein